MGICNGIAGIIAPVILGSIILDNADLIQKNLINLTEGQKLLELQSLADRVILPYLVITLILIALAIFVYFSNLPEADTDHEDEELAAANINKTSILQFPHLLLGVFTLFLYVGVEVIAGDTIISYGASEGIPLTTAKYFTSATLSAMLAGYLIGIISIPKYIKQETALIVSAVLGILFALTAVFTSGLTSVIFIALLGLSNSLIWPSIWPLAIADLGRFTKIGSSLMIMAVGGGALLPLVYGHLADIFNNRDAYWIVVPCYLMILYYSVYGHKIRKH
jgi:glucose/galactose transporter